MEKEKFNYKKLIMQIMLVFVYVICFFSIIIPFLATALIYELSFGKRADKPRHVIDINIYPDLLHEDVEFSNGKHMLRGGVFKYKGNNNPKAAIIVGHGIGCNMNLYLNRINYFAKKGYLVMGLDMSGTDKSEGKGLGGVVQSQLDIKSAVLYAKSREDFKGLKLFVYGHSWSGYGCASMLNDDEVVDKVDAVATMSGFNDTWQIITYQADKYCGKFIWLAYPWMMLYQFIKYGKRAFKSCMDGINHFNKPVLVTQSKDDPTVPLYLSVYGAKDECTNKYAEFILFEDRGHTTSRPIDVEAKICKDCEGKVYNKPMDTNMFEYFVNMHYEWSTVEDVEAIDYNFMDQVDNFFDKYI